MVWKKFQKLTKSWKTSTSRDRTFANFCQNHFIFTSCESSSNFEDVLGARFHFLSFRFGLNGHQSMHCKYQQICSFFGEKIFFKNWKKVEKLQLHGMEQLHICVRIILFFNLVKIKVILKMY